MTIEFPYKRTLSLCRGCHQFLELAGKGRRKLDTRFRQRWHRRNGVAMAHHSYRLKEKARQGRKMPERSKRPRGWECAEACNLEMKFTQSRRNRTAEPEYHLPQAARTCKRSPLWGSTLAVLTVLLLDMCQTSCCTARSRLHL